MTFSGQSFERRFAKMGDQAEGVFENVYPQGWTRYGLSRPPINLTNVPAFIRYTPDYLTAKGLVEVQGFGRDQVMKLKCDKYQALLAWAQSFRVDLFLWDSHNGRYGFVRLGDLQDAFGHHGWQGAFDEGRNPFNALSAADIPVDKWVEHGR